MSDSARRLRDLLLVAQFELADALRSRGVLGLLLVYLAGSVTGAAAFVSALASVEKALAAQLAVATTSKPGNITDALRDNEQFRQILGDLVGDASLVDALVAIPPMALFYGWLALTFVPALVVLSSCDTIAAELGSGSARYALARTDRLSWVLGKLTGQAALMAVGIAIGALGCWVVGFGWLAHFDAAGTAWWLLRLGSRAWVYGFAYLGLALGVSQLVRSANGARALAIAALIAVGVGRQILGIGYIAQHYPILSSTLLPLFPGYHAMDLWRPDLGGRGPAMVMLLALGGTFFALGHAVLVRRDA